MKVKELLEKLEELRKENPDIEDLEIGPLFYNEGREIITMVDEIKLVPESAWEDSTNAIGIN